MTCHGVPEFVVVKGRVCVDDGNLRVGQGHGSFIETPVFPPYVYNPLNGVKNGTNGDEADSNGLEHVTANVEQLAIEIPTPDPINTFLAGPALSMLSSDTRASTPSGRAPRQDGQRNMQDSTFSISGKHLHLTCKSYTFLNKFYVFTEEVDQDGPRSSIRVRNPPGGKSSGFW